MKVSIQLIKDSESCIKHSLTIHHRYWWMREHEEYTPYRLNVLNFRYIFVKKTMLKTYVVMQLHFSTFFSNWITRNYIIIRLAHLYIISTIGLSALRENNPPKKVFTVTSL